MWLRATSGCSNTMSPPQVYSERTHESRCRADLRTGALQYSSAVGPVPAHHPARAAGQGRADALALARHRAVRRARGQGSGDRGRRAPRADPRASGVRRRDRHHPEPDRRLYGARARRQGGAAPAHRRGDPLLHARRGRRHHRQRSPLRDEGRRPGADAADVLARPHQPERPAHGVVRRRQHAGDLRARRELLRAGQAPGRALLGGE